MRLKALLASAAMAGVLTAGGGTAQADVLPPAGSLDYDFRTMFDATANNQASVSGGGVTVTANPGDPGLFWAADDGFGVLGGEDDEINYPESLTVDFDSPQALAGVWLSDIFRSGDGVDDEEATIELFSGATSVYMNTFAGNEPLGTNNGGLFADFAGTIVGVSRAVFTSIDQTNDEYSVVGFTAGTITEVPEPASLGLLGLGLFGLAGLRRRRS